MDSAIPSSARFSCRSFLLGRHPLSIQSRLPQLSFIKGVGVLTSGKPNWFIRCQMYWIPFIPSSTALSSPMHELLLPRFSLVTPQSNGPPILVIWNPCIDRSSSIDTVLVSFSFGCEASCGLQFESVKDNNPFPFISGGNPIDPFRWLLFCQKKRPCVDVPFR